MIPQPLHPALVHFPIVFAVLLPASAVAALVFLRRGASVRTAWVPVLMLSGLLAASAWIAVQSGEAEEEAVESVLAESVIHEHEEAAELLLVLSGLTLLLVAAGLTKGRAGSALRVIATAFAFGLLFSAYQTGHSGGALVFEHGAAQAYTRVDTDRSSDARGESDRDRDGSSHERERDDHR